MTDDRQTVATFRPDDERLSRTVERLDAAGVEPIADPMLAVEPTGATPRTDVDVVAFTSKTGVELAADANWSPEGASIAAIGDSTATVLRSAGFSVDLVPEEFTSSGLVAALAERIERGDVATVEVARSDHGSDVLLDGLADASASVHETVLYELERPAGAGDAAELAAAGGLDGALFTSSLTVEHFLEAAAERGIEAAARDGLADAVVGAIGPPTAATVRDAGIAVDVVPEAADAAALVDAVVAELP